MKNLTHELVAKNSPLPSGSCASPLKTEGTMVPITKNRRSPCLNTFLNFGFLSWATWKVKSIFFEVLVCTAKSLAPLTRCANSIPVGVVINDGTKRAEVWSWCTPLNMKYNKLVELNALKIFRKKKYALFAFVSLNLNERCWRQLGWSRMMLELNQASDPRR